MASYADSTSGIERAGGSLAQSALKFVGYGVLAAVGGGATRLASRFLAGKALTYMAGTASPAAKIFDSLSPGKATLGSMVRSFVSADKAAVSGAFGARAANFQQALNQHVYQPLRAYEELGLGKTVNWKGDNAAREVGRAYRALTGNKRAIAGAAISQMNTYAGTLPGFYAADRVFNPEEHQQGGIKDFAKFATMGFVYDFVPRMGMLGGRMGFARMAESSRSIAAPHLPKIEKFKASADRLYDRASNFVNRSRIAGNAYNLAFGAEMRGAFRARGSVDTMTGRLADRAGRVGSAFGHAYEALERAWGAPGNKSVVSEAMGRNKVDEMGGQAAYYVRSLTDMINAGPENAGAKMLAFNAEQVAGRNERVKNVGVMGRWFGMNRAMPDTMAIVKAVEEATPTWSDAQRQKILPIMRGIVGGGKIEVDGQTHQVATGLRELVTDMYQMSGPGGGMLSTYRYTAPALRDRAIELLESNPFTRAIGGVLNAKAMLVRPHSGYVELQRGTSAPIGTHTMKEGDLDRGFGIGSASAEAGLRQSRAQALAGAPEANHGYSEVKKDGKTFFLASDIGGNRGHVYDSVEFEPIADGETRNIARHLATQSKLNWSALQVIQASGGRTLPVPRAWNPMGLEPELKGAISDEANARNIGAYLGLFSNDPTLGIGALPQTSLYQVSRASTFFRAINNRVIASDEGMSPDLVGSGTTIPDDIVRAGAAEGAGGTDRARLWWHKKLQKHELGRYSGTSGLMDSLRRFLTKFTDPTSSRNFFYRDAKKPGAFHAARGAGPSWEQHATIEDIVARARAIADEMGNERYTLIRRKAVRNAHHEHILRHHGSAVDPATKKLYVELQPTEKNGVLKRLYQIRGKTGHVDFDFLGDPSEAGADIIEATPVFLEDLFYEQNKLVGAVRALQNHKASLSDHRIRRWLREFDDDVTSLGRTAEITARRQNVSRADVMLQSIYEHQIVSRGSTEKYYHEVARSLADDLARTGDLSEYEHGIFTTIELADSINEISKVDYPRGTNAYYRRFFGTVDEWSARHKTGYDLLDRLSTMANGVASADDPLIERQKNWDNLFAPPGTFWQPVRSTARPGLFSYYLAGRFNAVLSHMGAGVNVDTYPTTRSLLLKGILGKRVVPAAGALWAYNALDAAVDANPLLDATFLDEGVTVAGADIAAKSRLMLASLGDAAGITPAAQYLEGLMPGVLNSPLSRAARLFGAPVLGALVGGRVLGARGMFRGGAEQLGALVGLGVGVATGMPDLTLESERAEDIYAGREEVPVRKGRYWMLSRESFFGGRIQHFSPNWYARLKAKPYDTPTRYGSGIERALFGDLPILGWPNPIGFALDPYHWEKKSYYSRPYVETGAAFAEVPIVGPLLAATIGKIAKPNISMHDSQLEVYANAWGGAPGVGFGSGGGMDVDPTSGVGVAQIAAVRPNALQARIGDLTSQLGDIGGMYGFLAESLSGSPQMSRAWAAQEWAYSPRRTYWDSQIGDPFGITEGLRRVIPNRRSRMIEWINPLANRMPGWLPGPSSQGSIDFRHGDPYVQLPQGEMRLPGAAYESLYDVTHTFPVRTEELEANWMGMVRRMIGVAGRPVDEEALISGRGRLIKQMYQSYLAKSGLAKSLNQVIYDPFHDVGGTVDAAMRTGNGQQIVQIKPVPGEMFRELSGPLKRHVEAQNILMGLSKSAGTGLLYYINMDDPGEVKTFDTAFDPRRFRTTMSMIERARQYAGKALADGVVPTSYGASYSHLDRLRVLSKAAPWSEEYDAEIVMLKQQARTGKVSDQDLMEVERIETQRRSMMRAYDFYPRRFQFNQLMAPDAQVQLMSENAHIRAAADYSLPERVVGGLWEEMQRLTPFRSKLMPYYSPREAYEEFALYGDRHADWKTPIESFVAPQVRMMVSSDKFTTNVMSGMHAGVIGGPIGMTAGAALGAGIGLAKRALGASSYARIPAHVRQERNIDAYFDQLAYERARRLYAETGLADYADQMAATIAANPDSAWGLAAASPEREKPFVFAFATETNPAERTRILGEVDPRVGNVLRRLWGEKVTLGNEGPGRYWMHHRMPSDGWAGWGAGAHPDDYKLRSYEKEGLNAHHAGLGWIDQTNRATESGAAALDWRDAEDRAQYNYAASTAEITAAVSHALGSLGAQVVRIASMGDAQDRVVVVRLMVNVPVDDRATAMYALGGGR